MIYVVFGATDLAGTLDLADHADLIIQGARSFGFLGTSLDGAGDVNGDGIGDMIIGDQDADPSGRYRAGASYIIFGGNRGLPATIDLASDADLVIEGAAANDFSGRSVSGAGDVNGDGFDDLMIGAPGVDSDIFRYSGATYVLFGTDQGFPPMLDLREGADVVMQNATSESLGSSVSGAGDVNGDGVGDLIIGDQDADPNGRDSAGESYVVFGATNLAGAVDLADPVRGADLIIQGAAEYDSSGRSVDGAGDVNGDGFDAHRRP